MELVAILTLGIACMILVLLVVIFIRKWFHAMSIISKIKAQNRALEAEIHRKENIIVKEKASRREISISYFTETSKNERLFSESYSVCYKMQLIVDDLPIGQASIIKTDTFKKVDKSQVNQTLQDFAKPLLEIGIRVALAQIKG